LPIGRIKPMPNEISLNALFAASSEWQKGIFPDATPISAAYHLRDEAREVVLEAEMLMAYIAQDGNWALTTETTREQLALELADVIHLCIACASAANIHLPTAIEKKFQKNQTRNFTYDPDRGYSKGD
jgi:NTP pyrophosphatase (non-canonical NTP hydrolase)